MGVIPKKSFGQHFLHDQSVLEKIVAVADPAAFAHVVEVGPGTGALTALLAPLAKRLTLVEADRDLVEPLQETYPQAVIVRTDAVRVDFSSLVEGEWCLVANLPYNAANAIIMNALATARPPRHMVVMVQKEVGERLLAQPGAMSVLGVAVSLYATVERVCVVKPGAFNPPPKVDSMVVKIITKPGRNVPETEQVIALAKAGFANRRKLLARNLATAGLADADMVRAWLRGAGYSEQARAEELRPEDWVQLWSAAA